jgi:hypothetical protein
MEVGVKIDPVPEGPDGGNDPRRKHAPGHNLEVSGQGPEGAAAEIGEEPALVLEEDPQHLGDGEDDLTVWHVQEKRLPHPLAPLLQTLGMTRGAESPGAAGEHKKPLLPTVRTPDAGKPAAGIAAVKIALHDLVDDRPEKTVLLLETTFILSQESVEMMKQHPVERWLPHVYEQSSAHIKIQGMLWPMLV